MNKRIEKLILGISVSILISLFPVNMAAQTRWIEPVPLPEKSVRPSSEPVKVNPNTPPPRLFLFGGETSEKSINVDSNVNLSLCVTQGKVKVNGWNRNEIRVFVEDGSPFNLHVRQKSPKSGEPVWIMVTGVNTKNKYAVANQCIWGREIEIDVPLNATINIKGEETTTTIDSVKKVDIHTIGGDITLRKVADGIKASAGQGDITVEDSGGGMDLVSTTGNIIAFEAGPSEIGDIFKAKTNSGSIYLQRVNHRQLEVNSISGSVAFTGGIILGGAYRLSTSKGSIRMAIPADTSGQLIATYGYGSFNSEIPVKISMENISEGPIKSIVGTLGKGGESILKLTSNNGSISIKKQ